MPDHRIEVFPSRVRQVVDHQRGTGRRLTDVRPLVVEHPQRVDLRSAPRLFVQIESEEELLQGFPILRPAGVITE